MLDLLYGVSYRFASNWSAGIEGRWHHDSDGYFYNTHTQTANFIGPERALRREELLDDGDVAPPDQRSMLRGWWRRLLARQGVGQPRAQRVRAMKVGIPLN